MNKNATLPETLTVQEVAACAALVAAPEIGREKLAPESFDASMAGLFEAIDEGPLPDFHERGLRGYMALLAATWILFSLPDDTRIPVCPSLRYALEQEPGLLDLARRFLAGKAVPVRSRGPAQK